MAQRCDCVTEPELEDCVVATRSSVEEYAALFTAPVDLDCLRTAARSWGQTPCTTDEIDFEAVQRCALAQPNALGAQCSWGSRLNYFFDFAICESGLACDGNTCVDFASVPEGGTCATDLECTAGLVCIDERCTGELMGLGGACLSHDHCQFFAFCDEGFCAPCLDQFEPCKESAACAMPFQCVDDVCDFPDRRLCR